MSATSTVIYLVSQNMLNRIISE